MGSSNVNNDVKSKTGEVSPAVSGALLAATVLGPEAHVPDEDVLVPRLEGDRAPAVPGTRALALADASTQNTWNLRGATANMNMEK